MRSRDVANSTRYLGGMFAGPSVGSILAANKGHGPGFDLCRIGLSVAVVLIHSWRTTVPDAPTFEGWAHPPYAAILALFFGLSGFLVTGSALRLRDVRTFLAFRILRIVPALMVEVTLSALVLGTLLTTVPLGEYFASRQFLVYFGNIVGWIHFFLPGVFETNPRAMVNANLWTLHPELLCYAIMAGLMLTGLVYSRVTMTTLWVLGTIGGIVLNLWRGSFELQLHFVGDILIYCFLTGVVAFHWRDYIPVNRTLFILACVASYVLLLLPHTVIIVQVPLIYVIVWLGMQRFPRIALLQRGDYSYGIYLYSYPVQQTIIHLVPAFAVWWFVFPVSTVTVFAIAALSWHFIEKPALRLKKHVLRARPTEPTISLTGRGAAPSRH